MAFLLDHLPPRLHLVIASRADPAAAAGPAAGARRAGRDPRRRPALHARRGRGVPQRGDGPGADGAGRRRAGGAHRRLDRRAPAGGALDAGARRRRRLHRRLRRATTATSSTTWSRRSCSASPTRSGRFLLQTSILDRLSGPLCDAVTGQDGGKAMLEALDEGTCSWSRSTTAASGIATTTSSPTCCVRACWTSSPTTCRSCTGGRARGTSRTASRPRRSATRWPPGTSTRAADLVELAAPGHAPGAGRRRRCAAGSRRSPTS